MRKRIVHIDPYIFHEQNRLGSGAFSTVYRGGFYPNKGDEKAFFAIKEIAVATDEKIKEFVQKEVEIMGKLNHPHIVRITDVITTKDYVYIVMEYCNMGNLREFVLGNQLSEEEISHLLRQIVSAFKHIRKLNLIHRDIKPDNILINNFETKIADFGFAKVLNEINEQANTYAGTPMYMAPQVLRGEFYTSQADLWSLGVLFYFCYIKKEPWLQTGEKALKNSIMVLQRIEQMTSSNNLPFPHNVVMSDSMKDLISSMLKEKGQISWDQLFKHELFHEELELNRNNSSSAENQTLFKNISKVEVLSENQSLENALNEQDNLFKKNVSMTEDAIFVSKRIQHERDSLLLVFNSTLLMNHMRGRLKEIVKESLLDEVCLLLLKRIRNWSMILLHSLISKENIFNLENRIWNNFLASENPNEYSRLIRQLSQENESHRTNFEKFLAEAKEKGNLKDQVLEFMKSNQESFEEIHYTEKVLKEIILELKPLVIEEKKNDLLLLLDNFLISLTIKGSLIWNPKKPFNIQKFYEDRRNCTIEFLKQRILLGINFIASK